MLETRICKYCKKEFETHHWTKLKYCNRVCAGLSKVIRIKKICKYCKKEFEVMPSRKNAVYCSKKCNYAGLRHKKVEIKCKYCGKLFEAPRGHHRKVCSKECAIKYCISLPQSIINRLTGNPLGEKHPSWKGGVTKYDGRYHIRVNGKVHLRSHINWMKANEIYMIPKGFVIHHIDLDPSNDNPNNLILLPNGYHAGFHLKLRNYNKKHAEVY